MNDVIDYLARYPVRKGKLATWQNDIVTLRAAGASYRSICRYLAEHGVTAGPEEVQRFLHRRGRQCLVVSPAPGPRKTERDKPGTSLPKFEWTPGKPKTPW